MFPSHTTIDVEALVKHVIMLIAVLAVAPAVAGQDADDYRGGWRTDSGEAHVYEFSIRGTTYFLLFGFRSILC
jgi:hypothetical protein